MGQTLDSRRVEALYRRYGSLVELRCRAFLRDSADIADVVQDVFVRLLDKGGAFRADAQWSTYLYRMTTNLCINRLRDTKRRTELLVTHGDPVRPTPVFLTEAMDARQLLEAILQQTSATTREIIYYRYIDGMSYREIGQIIGRSGEAVRKQLGKFHDDIEQHPEWQAQ